MGRFLLFLFGIVVGAIGMFGLYSSGLLKAPGPLPVEGIATANAPPTPVPAPSEPYPQLAWPATITDGARTAAPASAATVGSAAAATLATPASVANASEQTQPNSREGAAAVTAAASTAAAGLLMPVQGVTSSQLFDTFTQSRGAGRLHDAIDIMAARGTPVLAVADGRVAKLFNSKQGGLTVYQFDRDEKLAYYYAHLDAYAPNLAEGQQLKRGDVLGLVGSTGNANPSAPHLHFAVFVLGPEKNWWQGTAVNPYPLLGGK